MENLKLFKGLFPVSSYHHKAAKSDSLSLSFLTDSSATFLLAPLSTRVLDPALVSLIQTVTKECKYFKFELVWIECEFLHTFWTD